MRILVTNDDGIHAHGPEGLRGDRARAVRRRLGGRAGVRPVRRVAFAVAQRSAAAARGRRAPLRGEGHADRLRHHGRAPHPAEAARSRAVRRQPRPQRRRGRALFRHGRGREGGRACSAFRRSRCRRPIPPASKQQPYWETAAQARARHHPPRARSRASRATCWSTSTFPDCAPDEVKGIAVSSQGKRDQELLHIDARHDGRGNPYYWIAYARGAQADRRGRHRSLRRSPTTASR